MKPNTVIALSIVALLAPAHAAGVTAPLDAALVGHWISAEGQITDFEPDKSFRMYPKCDEAAKWKSQGVAFLPAKWEIVNRDHLKLTLSAHGHTQVVYAHIRMPGDELRLTDPSDHVTVNKRYTGAWPPVCASKP